MPVYLFDLADGREIGLLTDTQFQFLADQLESEDMHDDDYYINQTTLDVFETRGIDPTTLDLLRTAMAGRPEMDIRWQRDEPTDSPDEPSIGDSESTA